MGTKTAGRLDHGNTIGIQLINQIGYELWAMAQIVHVERFVQTLCHGFDGTDIYTTIGKEAFVKRNVLHHALDEIGVVADDGTTACKAQLACREVDDIHLVGHR